MRDLYLLEQKEKRDTYQAPLRITLLDPSRQRQYSIPPLQPYPPLYSCSLQ